MISENTSKIGLIFDLDGTLLDSTGLLSHIPVELGKKYHVSVDESTANMIKEKILSAIRGTNSRFLILRLIFFTARKYRVSWFLRLRYLRDAIKLYKKLVKEVPIFPGIRETLQFLTIHGIPIAINTTASKSEVLDRFENRMDFLELFADHVITRSDIKKMKPNPESIIMLSNKMGLKIKDLIIIGDMNSDIEAGQNAGCTTVGVLTGYSTREMMQSYHPDFIIESVKDLPSVFLKLKEHIGAK